MIDDLKSWFVSLVCGLNSFYRQIQLSFMDQEKIQELYDRKAGILCKPRKTVRDRKALRQICWQLGEIEFDYRLLFCQPDSYRRYRKTMKVIASLD